jgi:hypothetical protein
MKRRRILTAGEWWAGRRTGCPAEKPAPRRDVGPGEPPPCVDRWVAHEGDALDDLEKEAAGWTRGREYVSDNGGRMVEWTRKA